MDASHMNLIDDFDVDILHGKIVVRAKCKKDPVPRKNLLSKRRGRFLWTLSVSLSSWMPVFYMIKTD